MRYVGYQGAFDGRPPVFGRELWPPAAVSAARRRCTVLSGLLLGGAQKCDKKSLGVTAGSAIFRPLSPFDYHENRLEIAEVRPKFWRHGHILSTTLCLSLSLSLFLRLQFLRLLRS